MQKKKVLKISAKCQMEVCGRCLNEIPFSSNFQYVQQTSNWNISRDVLNNI